MFAEVLLLAPPVVLWLIERGSEEPASRRWFRAAAGLCVMGFGIFLMAGSSSTAALLAPVVPSTAALVVGAVYRVNEARSDHKIRAGVGMSTLRRRIHWGWMALPAFIGSGLLTILSLWGLETLRPGTLNPRSDALMAAELFIPLAGTTLACGVQAWRQRVRDHEITQHNRRAPGIVPAIPDPPTWVPVAMGRWWVRLNTTLDAQVPKGREVPLLVIGGAINIILLVLTPVVTVAIGKQMLVAAPTGPGSFLLPIIIALAAIVATAIAVGLIGLPTLEGARTAVRQLRETDPPKT